MYHVTLTKHLKRIRKHGLLPFQTSNWVRTDNGERYGEGELYAFEHWDDALRWAGRMDWCHHKATGSGKVTILEFTTAHPWDEDLADPMNRAGQQGKWLKSYTYVAPEAIIGTYPVTLEMLRTLVARQLPGKAKRVS